MEVACRSCGSKRLLRGAHLSSPGFFGPYSAVVAVPGTSAYKGGVRSRLSAHVCVDCGAIELQAQDLAALQSAYAAIGQPLGLNL